MDAVGDHAAVLGAFGAQVGVMDRRAVAVLQALTAGAALIGHVPFLAPAGDTVGLPRGIPGRLQPPPSSCRRSSSMPKWWAISWITVMATSSTTSDSLWQKSSRASR